MNEVEYREWQTEQRAKVVFNKVMQIADENFKTADIDAAVEMHTTNPEVAKEAKRLVKNKVRSLKRAAKKEEEAEEVEEEEVEEVEEEEETDE